MKPKMTNAQKRTALRRELIDMKHYVQYRNKETMRQVKRTFKWSLGRCKRQWGTQIEEILDPLYIDDCIQGVANYPDELL